MKLDEDGELRPRDICMGGGFVEIGLAASITANQQVAEADVNALGVDLDRKSVV